MHERSSALFAITKVWISVIPDLKMDASYIGLKRMTDNYHYSNHFLNIYYMVYRNFADAPIGLLVTDGDRTGRIVKKSKDNSKALVRFSDGYTEWIEYYRIDAE
jgi:hypothetical protein